MLAKSVFRLKTLQEDKAHLKKGIADFGKIVNFTALWHSHSLSIYLWLLGRREPLESYKRRRWRWERMTVVKWPERQEDKVDEAEEGKLGVRAVKVRATTKPTEPLQTGAALLSFSTWPWTVLVHSENSDTNQHLNWSEMKESKAGEQKHESKAKNNGLTVDVGVKDKLNWEMKLLESNTRQESSSRSNFWFQICQDN